MHLGLRAYDAGQLLAGDGLGERVQRLRRPRPGEDEVVGLRPQRGAGDLAVVADEPEPEVLVETVADVAGDAEDQVVARLVGEQERLRLRKEGRRVVEPHDLHYSSSSTSTAPPATRSPSPTWTARTVAS